MSDRAGGPPPAVERVRLFVALELPAPIRASLIAWRDEALRRTPDMRPLGADSLHVTLCFLGWRDAAEIEPIAAACRMVAGEAAPLLSIGDPRWLPPRRPRVLAVALPDREGVLTRTQAMLSQVLAGGGWYQPEKRPYLPHVTVARVARGGGGARDRLPSPPGSEFHASRVTVYRSRLLRGGARYESLATIALQVAR